MNYNDFVKILCAAPDPGRHQAHKHWDYKEKGEGSMLKKRLRGLVSVLMAGSLLFSSLPGAQLAVEAASNSYEDAENPTLRDYADPSVRYGYPGQGADCFADESMETFWNGWGDSALGTEAQWMIYDFGERRATVSGSEIVFFDNNSGVFAPKGIEVETSLDGVTWTAVTPTGEWTIKPNEVSSIEFEPVVLSKIKITMDHAVDANNARLPVAVNDWKLTGEVPESFPKPEVIPPEEPSADLSLPDAAVYAVPESDFTSSWEDINQINNVDFEPTSSNANHPGWGNWDGNHSVGQNCYLQYN